MVFTSKLADIVYSVLNLANKWSLFIAIFVWPFGHLLKLSNVYLLDIACFLVFITSVLGKNFERIRGNLLFKSLNIFWFSLLTSILYALWQQRSQTPTVNFLYYLRVLAYPFLSFSVFSHRSTDLKKITYISGGTFILLALTQYLLLPDLRIYKNLGFDDHYYRLSGTLLDPNFTGAILTTLLVYLLLVKKHLASFLVLVSLALTFSRASYLSFIGALSFFVLQKKYLRLLLLVPLFAIVIYFSPKPFGEGVNLLRTYSITSRLVSLSDGLSLFLENPLFGVGFGHLVNSVGQKIGVDNSYVYILAGSGLLGLASFIFVIFAVLKSTSKNTYLLLLPILIHSLFNNSFFYIWIMSLFWIIVGYSLKENKST